MAELINKQDSLNIGREKINASILASERAEQKSDDAVNTANEALTQSESTQTQLDTIVINGDSSVEAAQARVDKNGHVYTTLKDRLDTENAETLNKIGVLTNNINKRGIDVYKFEGDDRTSITSAIQEAKEKNVTTVNLEKRDYFLSKGLVIDDIDTLTIEGNGARLIYSGNDTQVSNADYKMVRIINSKNITIRDLDITGGMFYGLDKLNLPTEPTHKSIHWQSNGVSIDNSENIFIEKVITRETYRGFEVLSNTNVNINECNSYDTQNGYYFEGCNGFKIVNSNSYDARYRFHDFTAYQTNQGIDTIGSQGRSFLFHNSRGVVEKCNEYRGASDGFRAQDDSEITFINCNSYSQRRNSFSVYGTTVSKINFISCSSHDVADPDFWNGTDTVDTFKRPADTYSRPRGFIVSEGEHQVLMDNCKVVCRFYTTDLVEDTSQIHRVKAPENLINFITGKHCAIRNCYFEGYATSSRTVSVSSTNTLMDNITVNNDKNSSVYNRTISMEGANNALKNSHLYYGVEGVYCGGVNNSIINNTIHYTFRTGLLCEANKNFIGNNTVIDLGKEGKPHGSTYGYRFNNCDSCIFENNKIIDVDSNSTDGGYHIQSTVTNIYIGDFKHAITDTGFTESVLLNDASDRKVF